jgi:hypothetical protein
MNGEQPQSKSENPRGEVILMGGEIIVLTEEEGVPAPMTDALRKRLKEKFPRPKQPPETPPETK